jgi:hypothetical protein
VAASIAYFSDFSNINAVLFCNNLVKGFSVLCYELAAYSFRYYYVARLGGGYLFKGGLNLVCFTSFCLGGRSKY